ncbi:putative bifunctional diguanylate cyclase/phosphodiesterase [Salinisphaera orenii]|uniref:putative bifunctional diguanylate cyclase/phosphodiesterase n=1 Tax=Salinisphaera orenii TaxID=856731 RepID=UPI00161B35FD|nr:EAL domain-containing protein [Salinisphaera orenii]
MARTLRSQLTRYACYGVLIALAVIVVATLATVLLAGEALTAANLLDAHRDNVGLLVLDLLLPLVFALWGQYVGVLLSDRAIAFARDDTRRLQADRALLEARARRADDLDALTGLANRAYFVERLESAVAAANLSRSRVAVMIIDLDGFSEVNDQFGSSNGDRVLKSVARRLDAALSEQALVARFGGDSFAVLLDPLRSAEVLDTVARRIEHELEPPCALDSLSLNLAGSIGGAIYPENGRDSHSLLAAAEGAMHRAKTQGGGFALVTARESLHDAEMHSLSSELRAAIEEDQLVLHLQPIVDIAADRVQGVEALVRWQHPRRGLIMPGDFIPRAERSGLISELSNWVLKRALSSAADLHAAGWPLGISVNLSARTLLDPHFPDALAELLAAVDLPSRYLTVEITEDTLMADQQRTLDVVTRVANMGVHISIDDFGTGYSQLAYLKRLPASEIKIDRSFVEDMLVSRTDLSIVQATIGLAHALELRAVAEGIETESQAERLRQLGCDYMQGYYIGRPMPEDKFRDWLGAWDLYHASAGGPAGPETRSNHSA